MMVEEVNHTNWNDEKNSVELGDVKKVTAIRKNRKCTPMPKILRSCSTLYDI